MLNHLRRSNPHHPRLNNVNDHVTVKTDPIGYRKFVRKTCVVSNSRRSKRQVDSTRTRTRMMTHVGRALSELRGSADRLTPQEELLKIVDKRRNSCQQQVRHWNISLTNWILISQPLETDSTDLLLIANAKRQVLHVRAGEPYEPAVSAAVVSWRLIKVYFYVDDKNWVTSNWTSCLWCITSYNILCTFMSDDRMQAWFTLTFGQFTIVHDLRGVIK